MSSAAPTTTSGDGRHSTLLLMALALGAFAIGTAEFSGMSLLPFYAAELGLDQPTASHAISLYALGVVVGAPFLAIAMTPVRRVAAAAALIAAVAIANLLTALLPGYVALLTMRFVSGLPHGAFFGQAALIAAAAMPERRAQSVALVMTGLTVATIVGAPAANLLGQTIGWRWGFVIAASAGVTSAVGLFLLRSREDEHATSPLGELAALRRSQVWLTLAAGAIGFGGLFAVYAYLPAILTRIAGAPERVVPAVLLVFGVGMTVGNLVAGWATDRWPRATGFVLLALMGTALALLPLLAGSLATLMPPLFVIACGAGLGPVLQTRLMDVAGEAQTLPAALHHSAFNIANALGPWLAGMAITGGFGWTSTGLVGCAMALVGLVILGAAILLRRRSR